MRNKRQISFWRKTYKYQWKLRHRRSSCRSSPNTPLPSMGLQCKGEPHAKTWLDPLRAQVDKPHSKARLGPQGARPEGSHSADYKDARTSEEMACLDSESAVVKRAEGFKKKGQRERNEYSMQSSCWEPKELSRVLAWKNRKGNSKRHHLQGPTTWESLDKETEVKEQRIWNLSGQSHTLHPFPWLGLQLALRVVGFFN